MNKPLPMHLSPRCRATSKRTAKPCRAPAVTGWKVCRFHGARGGAPRGPANGAYSSGLHTKEAIAGRKHVAALIKSATKLTEAMGEGEPVAVSRVLMEDAL
ncbi:hypothetical protein [Taklimakanibacter albus]|uniref:Uncharacterized protein n=1 Tax=Taklimakanibacter albus TaxID=2800327 RepID=A0ACC5R1A6_9HYPH|nr:hypothetical protein [Aestuariivirga sp. YIM B02566]MBK1866385.1 hypothetical protein [Aestuariivirga sp. YIM B02566]